LNKTSQLKNGKKPSTQHKLMLKPIIILKSIFNIQTNGTSMPEMNTVLVHAETSGINLHSPLLMPKEQQENGI
jgi:hypothetical protein